MIKRHQNTIYFLLKDQNLICGNTNSYDLNKDKYNFDIKYINKESELIYNFKLSVDTECFFYFNTLYIVTNNLVHPVDLIATAAFFLVQGNVSESDLLNVFKFIENEKWTNEKLKNLKLAKSKKENKLYISRLYLFEKKLRENNKVEGFQKMILKSRRIVSKFKEVDIKEKDIDYLLSKA